MADIPSICYPLLSLQGQKQKENRNTGLGRDDSFGLITTIFIESTVIKSPIINHMEKTEVEEWVAD